MEKVFPTKSWKRLHLIFRTPLKSLSFLLRDLFGGCFSVNLISDGSHEETHQRTEEVEETVREIGQCGYSEYGALRHAARVPRHKDGGDGHGVFRGTAEETTLIAHAVIDLLEHVSVEEDADVLVCHGKVERQSRADGGSDQADAVANHADEDVGDASHHSACRHRASETHGTENEPDGVEHAFHSSRRNKRGEHGVLCGQRGASVESSHDSLKGTSLPDLGQCALLKHQSEENCQEGGKEEGDDGWQAARNHDAGEERHEEQPGREGKTRVEGLAETLYFCGRTGVSGHSRHGEDDECERHGRYGGDEHVANVFEEWHADRACREDGGVGERRNFVSEIGTADDGSGNPSFIEALRLSDAHECDADGGDGGPGRAGHDTDQRTDDAAGGEEDFGANDFHAVVDERGDDTADHPRSAQCANQQEDDECASDVGDVVGDGFFEIFPRHFEENHAEEDAKSRNDEQRHLTRSGKGVAAIDLHHDDKHGDEDDERQQGNEG